MQLATPLTSHLSDVEFSGVYEPSEDSFLLMDAITSDISALRTLDPQFVLEMGYVPFVQEYEECFVVALLAKGG